MKNVVVVAGQSGKEIVKEFQEQGYNVLLICGKPEEAGSDIANDVLIQDLSKIRKIYSVIKEYSNLVFFGTGHNLAIELAKFCNSNGCSINFDPEIANLFKNKLRTHNFIEELGYLTPLEHVIVDNSDSYSPKILPVILKSEQDSYKTEMVNTYDEYRRVKNNILSTGSKVLVERFINGFEVTIPVIADKDVIKARASSLDMDGINEKAVSILKGFDLDREKNSGITFNNSITPDIKKRIIDAVETIISKSKFFGYPRFDIMVKEEKFYILEINSIMVTALGGTHYPWERVGINPARDMVNVFLKNVDTLLKKE